MRTRLDGDFNLDRADLLFRATVGAPLVNGDLRADEALVDRVGRLLDVPLRCRVEAVLFATRERERNALEDAAVEQVRLRRLEVLRVLLRVGQVLQVGAELLAHRTLNGSCPLLLDDLLKRHPHLKRTTHVGFGRLHRDDASFTLDDLGDDCTRGRDAVRLNARSDLGAVLGIDLLRDGGIEPLRLTGLCAEVFLRLAQLDDLGLGDIERLKQRCFADLIGTRLNHREAVLGADDDQIERRLLVDLLERRVDDQIAIDEADTNCAHRAEERQR